MKQPPSPNKESTAEINWNGIENYLRSQNIVLDESPLEVQQFSTGYSNLTYFIKIGEWKAVLRRPPFGPIPPKAHDMKREYEVLLKINQAFPLAPKPYLYCEDESIMKRHFYIMEKKDGVVIDESLPEKFEVNPLSRRVISEAVVKTLTKLHDIDIRQAGLETLGYPEGYLSRQVHGWIRRYQNTKTDEIAGVEELEKWLVNHIPVSPEPTVVHNDFKLNNMMFSAKLPIEVVGLFDWELSTIGDPLTDVASMIAYWKEEGDPYTGITSITKQTGFASRREMLEMYARQSGRNVDQFDYYLTFAFYKIAGILQQIYYRWKMGEAKDDRFAKLGEGAKNIMQQAMRAQRKEFLR
ncbi:aminoglycoside phosphotransferase [Neobacillus bataviensis LMG 21833]|uniref:Aminoglycoside phosphotransferase n=1 Tax=Neobacillus bataviensis LMG 21833 TaxID=1117379 RepID=K6CKI9_9BACI|nr:phosphotransferase family protein [Neobacillus bataviensis]EKN71670.1 aminoglycoside phosphotransferase [Neobacillus bataviensis LMG 21833]